MLPGIYTLNPTRVHGLWDVKYGSNSTLPDDFVKQQIITDIKRLQMVGKGPSNPEFVVYSGDVPFQLNVPAQAIADGFYKKLYTQGQRNMWYTGAAWHVHDSSFLWQFTEDLLPGIMGPMAAEQC